MGVTGSSDAVCARADEIIYVKAVATCPSAPDGSMGDPFCDIDDAIAKIPNGGFIRVLDGGAQTLDSVKTVLTHGYAIVADPGTALVAGSGAITSVAPPNGFTIDGGALYLSGMNFLSSEASAILCKSGALRLSHVDIQNAGSAAVEVSSGSVNIDAVLINSSGAGIDQGGGILSVTNSLITDNKGIGVSIAYPVSVDLFAFNTIMNNNPGATTPGALACGKKMMVKNSIVRGNSQDSDSSWTGNCSFYNSDVDTTGTVGGPTNDLAPDFYGVNPAAPNLGFDYHLVPKAAANTACCLDMALAIPGIATDFDGDPRPAVGGDIGADQTL